MNFFEEIETAKRELPKLNSITKRVEKKKFNGYQIFSIVTFCVCFCLGIIFGNLFPACRSSSYIYSGVCTNTEFNFFLMIIFWFVSFLLCLFFYAMGTIIELLSSINNRLGKK